MVLVVESKNMGKSSTSITTVNCMICVDEVSQRSMIKCPFCDFEACKSCTEKFLLGIDDDQPRCMNNGCKKIWSFDLIADNFHISFYNKYLKRRAELLLEREKSLLPGTQELAKEEQSREKYKQKIDDIEDENKLYRALLKRNSDLIKTLRGKIRQTQDGLADLEEKKRNVFTRACPVENCRGFLSTALKCGVCSIYACKECHAPKKSKHDSEHKCDPKLVATVKLLANDTKPCPSCATLIHKINGCDQMYCTQCHTPFSWKKGTIERGVIHNPHYYEAQRALNNGVVLRNHGDVGCGGVPELSRTKIYVGKNGISYISDIQNAHRLIGHITAVELPRYPTTLNGTDTAKLRVDYLLNRITEKQWQSKLTALMKKHEKNREFAMVLQMFTATLTDIMHNITSNNNNDNITNQMETMKKLREYTNNALRKIGERHKNVYPTICENFEFWPSLKSVGKTTRKRRTRH